MSSKKVVPATLMSSSRPLSLSPSRLQAFNSLVTASLWETSVRFQCRCFLPSCLDAGSLRLGARPIDDHKFERLHALLFANFSPEGTLYATDFNGSKSVDRCTNLQTSYQIYGVHILWCVSQNDTMNDESLPVTLWQAIADFGTTGTFVLSVSSGSSAIMPS